MKELTDILLAPYEENTMSNVNEATFLKDVSRGEGQPQRPLGDFPSDWKKPGKVMRLPNEAQREFAEANALWNAIEALNRLRDIAGRHTNFLRPSSLAVLNATREVLDMEFRSPGKAEEIAPF